MSSELGPKLIRLTLLLSVLGIVIVSAWLRTDLIGAINSNGLLILAITSVAAAMALATQVMKADPKETAPAVAVSTLVTGVFALYAGGPYGFSVGIAGVAALMSYTLMFYIALRAVLVFLWSIPAPK